MEIVFVPKHNSDNHVHTTEYLLIVLGNCAVVNFVSSCDDTDVWRWVCVISSSRPAADCNAIIRDCFRSSINTKQNEFAL